jgi:hypothetical protein
MSRQPFERQVANELAKVPGLWLYHPSDEGAGKPRRPADFIYGHANGWGCVEVKSTVTATLAQARWTPQQRQAAVRCVEAGGRYFLLVRFPQGIRAFDWDEMDAGQRYYARGIRHDAANARHEVLATLGALLLGHII